MTNSALLVRAEGQGPSGAAQSGVAEIRAARDAAEAAYRDLNQRRPACGAVLLARCGATAGAGRSLPTARLSHAARQWAARSIPLGV